MTWSFGSDWITGDDFTIGATGELWVITKLSGWSVEGSPDDKLGNWFQNVTLYGGPVDSALSPLISGNLTVASNINSNPNITHTPVQYVGGLDYQGSSGSYYQIWQHDFNIAWVVAGGEKYGFAADGLLKTGVFDYWFNHASNAALSGSLQQGADNLYLGWYRPDDFPAPPFYCDSGNPTTCGGWDKSSDINVQIFATLWSPGDKNQCKNGGWKTLFRANSTSFKNQGDCIQYVNTGK